MEKPTMIVMTEVDAMSDAMGVAMVVTVAAAAAAAVVVVTTPVTNQRMTTSQLFTPQSDP